MNERNKEITSKLHISLVSFLQLLAYEKSDATIEVESDGQSGFIYVKNGSLLGCTFEKHTGFKALEKILGLKKYTFTQIDDIKNIDKNLNIPLEEALLKIIALNEEKNKKIKLKEEKMGKAEEIQKLQEQLAEELPGFIACTVVRVNDGLPIAGTTTIPNYDVSVPSGSFAQALRAVNKAYKYSKWGDVNDCLLEGSEILVALITLKNGEYFQGIAVKSSTAIGMVRAVYGNFKEKIESLL